MAADFVCRGAVFKVRDAGVTTDVFFGLFLNLLQV